MDACQEPHRGSSGIARLRQAGRVVGRSNMTLKDWFTVTLSICAFFISAATAYFNIVRQQDNLSVSVASFPDVVKLDDEQLLVGKDEAALVFINSGNRAAAITGVSIFFMQHDQQSKCDEVTSGNNGAWFLTDMEPIVVKQNDITTKTVKIIRPFASSNIQKNEFDKYLFPIEGPNKGKKESTIETCLSISFSTPSHANGHAYVSAFKYQSDALKIFYDPVEMDVAPWNAPRSLIRNWGTIFGP
jgi:hypothetical protein